jgi:hypothetical protein
LIKFLFLINDVSKVFVVNSVSRLVSVDAKALSNKDVETKLARFAVDTRSPPTEPPPPGVNPTMVDT